MKSNSLRLHRNVAGLFATLLIGGGLLVVAPGTSAGIAIPPQDVTHYSLSCGSASGKVSFSPPLTMSGGQGPLMVTIKGKLTNCTATPPPSGGPPVSIKLGKFTGSFVSPVDPGCPGLLNTNQVEGTMNLMWKTAAGTPKLSSGGSSVQFSMVKGGEDPVGDVFTEIPGSGAGGSFQGTDAGFFDVFHASFGDFDVFVKKCSSPNGLKSAKLMTGSTTNLG